MSAPNHFYGSAMTIPRNIQYNNSSINPEDDPVIPEVVESTNEPEVYATVERIGDSGAAPSLPPQDMVIEDDNDDDDDVVEDQQATIDRQMATEHRFDDDDDALLVGNPFDDDDATLEGHGYYGGYYNVLPFANPVTIIPIGGALAAAYNLQTDPLPIVNDGIMPAAEIDNALDDSCPAVIVPVEDVIATSEGYGLRKYGGAIRAYGYRTGDGEILYASGIGNLFKKIAGVAKKGLSKGVQIAKNVGRKGFQIAKDVGKTVGKDLLGNLASTAAMTVAENALGAMQGGAIIARGLQGGMTQDDNALAASTKVIGMDNIEAGHNDDEEIPTAANNGEVHIPQGLDISSPLPTASSSSSQVSLSFDNAFKRSITQAVKLGSIALSLIGSIYFGWANRPHVAVPIDCHPVIEQQDPEVPRKRGYVPSDYPWSESRHAREVLRREAYEEAPWPKSSNRLFKYKDWAMAFPGDEDKAYNEYRRAICRVDLDRMLDMVDDGKIDMIPYLSEEDKAKLRELASPWKRFNFMLARDEEGKKIARWAKEEDEMFNEK